MFDIGTGAILTEGTATFTPFLERLLTITKEFLPYFVYIAGGVLLISLIWRAVKMIMGRLAGGSKRAIRGR